MALPASDAFTGSNQALTTYSANWTNNVGAFRVVSNACCPNYTSGDAAAHWNADTFGDNQYAEATVVAIGSTDYVGVAVRCAASAATFYSFTGNSNDASYLSKYVAGTYTDLGTAAAFAVNDVIRLEAEGTTIRAKINGTTVLSVTDSGITSGYAGVGGAGNAESSRIDGWAAGNIGSSAQTINANAISSGASVYQPTVTPGAVTVAVNAISSSATVYQPAVNAAAGSQTINANAIGSSATVYQPTVTPGAVTVSANAIASAATVHGPWVLTRACIGGVLTVSGDNGRYFENDAGIVFLAGFHTWQVSGADSSSDDPPATLDFDEFLTALTSRGLTFTKMWAMEQPQNWPNLTQYFAPLPWARTGPGTANDGKPKFDLDTWDEDYFNRLREWTVRLGNAGVYVAVQMFQGWHYTDKGYSNDPYQYHPFNGPNNINSVDGDTNNDNSGLESLDTASSVYSRQQAYVRKVIDTVNDLDNVIFEVANEVDYTTTTLAWERAIAAYIKSYEAGLAQQHPVGITKFWPGGNNTALFDSDVEWTSTDEEYPTPAPDATDGSMVVIGDSDHWQGLTLEHEWTWQAFVRGMNVAYMDEWNGWTYGTDRRSDADAQKIRNQLGYIADYVAQVDLRYMTPQSALASTGYCLARTTGAAKLIAYQPGSGNFTVDLSSLSGTFTVEYLRPANGTTSAGSNVSGGGVRTMTAPWAGEDFVAFLEKVGDEISPNAIASTATVYQPTVTPGAVTVNASAISSTVTVYQVAVTVGVVTIAPNAIASTATVYQPTVTPGVVTVSANAISSGATVYQVAVTVGAVTVAPNAIASTATVYQPAITVGGFVVQPNAIASTASVYLPAITVGAVTIAPNAIASTATVYQPVVTVGAATVAPNPITSTAQVYAPAVIPGAVTVSLEMITSAATVYAPFVGNGQEQTILPNAIASTAQVFAVAITAITAGRIYRIKAEDRTYTVPAEDRTYTVTGD